MSGSAIIKIEITKKNKFANFEKYVSKAYGINSKA